MLLRSEIVCELINRNGVIFIVFFLEEVLKLLNEIVLEYLELYIKELMNVLDYVKYVGFIFFGLYLFELFGDYLVGLNYVLLMSGMVRFFFLLLVDDFVKKLSFIFYMEEVLKNV